MTTPDISVKEGDTLIISGNEYTVRAVDDWTMTSAYSRAFLKLATVEVDIKEPAAIVNGKAGEPQYARTDLLCTPIDPVERTVVNDIRVSLGINAPYGLFQTFLADDDGFYHLILEREKK